MNKQFHKLSRRELSRLALSLLVTATPSGGQTQDPQSAIQTNGSVATFSYDAPRPLESVASAFFQAYSLSVTFEEAALAHREDVIEVTVNPIGGRRAYRARGGPIEFSYSIAEDSGTPTEPGNAILSAINFHNNTGYPGTYELRTVDTYFHIVPIARRVASGINEPTLSPFDQTVSIEARGLHPNVVFSELLDTIQASSGHRIMRGFNPFYRGDHPTAKMDFINVSARAVLRSLLDSLQNNSPRTWFLMYDYGVKAYALSIR